MQVRPAQKIDVSGLAEFIARRQQDSSHHIGYVSDDSADITSSLLEIDGFEEQFFVAEDNTGIHGFLGVDLDDDHAWIYGPMCDAQNWHETVNALWKKLEPKLVEKKLLLFAHEKNTRFAMFALEIGCLEYGRECVLEFARTQLENLRVQAENARVISEKEFTEFTSLHDAIFPGTYFSGIEILERLNDQRQLFVYGEPELLGYSYAEVSNSGEASLEFIGVAENTRGKGVGKDLMIRTLEWIFSFANVEQVSLTVNAQNTAALAMYNTLGFLEVRRMISFRRSRT